MERKIGEIFEYNGEWYQCIVGSDCENCAFCGIYCYNFIDNDDSMGYCSIDKRKDNKEVIFKKLEKVGEPFTGKVLHIQFQRYKIYTKPIIDLAENVNYVDEGNTIAIEIKQNEEDMEERELNSHMMKVIDEATQELGEEIGRQIGENINKQRMKPFNLEAAKAGKPVCTRDGRKARIICFDRKDVRPIIALIKSDNYDDEGVYYYYADGLNLNSYPSAFDLMMLPEKKEGWVNIYDDMIIYESEEEAKIGIATARNYIATTKVEWEE